MVSGSVAPRKQSECCYLRCGMIGFCPRRIPRGEQAQSEPEELPRQRPHLGVGAGLMSPSHARPEEASPTFSCFSCPLRGLLPLLHAEHYPPLHTRSCLTSQHHSSWQPDAVFSLHHPSLQPFALSRVLLPRRQAQLCKAVTCSLHAGKHVLWPRCCGLPRCWHHKSPSPSTGLVGGKCLVIGRCQAAVRKLAAELLPAPTFLLLSLTSSLFINCPVPNRLPLIRRCSDYAGSIFHLPSKVTSSRMSCEPD